MVKPVRNAAGPNALTYNPTTGEISYTTSSVQTKENIVAMSRDSCGMLCDLEVKEFNYINKGKYIRYGTANEAEPFDEWLAAENESGNSLSAPEGTESPYVADEHNAVIQKKYADYVAKTETVPATYIDKEETHFGFLAEDVQKVASELVYDDIDGVALDIKWNNITALLVKEYQLLRADHAIAQTTIADLVRQNQQFTERLVVLEEQFVAVAGNQ